MRQSTIYTERKRAILALSAYPLAPALATKTTRPIPPIPPVKTGTPLPTATTPAWWPFTSSAWCWPQPPARRRHSICRALAILSRFANRARCRTTTLWNTSLPPAPLIPLRGLPVLAICWWALRAASTRPAAVTARQSRRKRSASRPSRTGAARGLRPSSLATRCCTCSATVRACAIFFIRWKKTAMRATTFPFLRRIYLRATPSSSGPTSKRPVLPSGACATTASCWPLPT